AATALVATKQVNAVLALSLVLTIVIGALRDPTIAARSLLRCALPALAPPLALYIAWRLYVAFNIVGGEFSIRPPEEWALSLIPEVIGGMISVASKKGGYFGLMLVALACGARAL